MFQIRRSFYNVGYISGTDAIAAAISGGTLINGDQLFYTANNQVSFGKIVGNALVTSTN
jgi:hypothetical protein